MSNNNQMFLKHKIVFLGDQSVGKTSIILRFSQDTYDGKQKVRHSHTKIHNFSFTLLGNRWN